MDYEKMYKAALKTAAQWIKDGCTDKQFKAGDKVRIIIVKED